jgi:omega-hydroxy-beta-dihydromenaquinone-9 sulfotransferase
MGKWRTRLARPQVIQGMTLATLLRVLARNGFMVDASCLGRLAHLLVMGVFNSLYGACETLLNSAEIEQVQVKEHPLFIIGHWRSGTTHLHNLLSVDEQFACPSAFQASCPNHFIFSQSAGFVFNLIAPTTRPMDDVAFRSHVPHEDEFAVAATSTVSPYMKILFPVTGDACHSQLDPHRLPEPLRNEWKDALLLFLKKVTFSEGRRVVFKSPPHLGRVGTLLEMFPRAQFLHIVRDPYTVYASTWKLWKDSFQYAHLQEPDAQQVNELILSWHAELFSLYERDRSLIPAGALHELKYEDLDVRPVETLRAAYAALGLTGFSAFETRVRAYVDSLRDYKKNVHVLTEADRETVRSRWRETFDRYGYPL